MVLELENMQQLSSMKVRKASAFGPRRKRIKKGSSLMPKYQW